jgi:Raf kinase inhibitor-like YbhB/YbcL family protein
MNPLPRQIICLSLGAILVAGALDRSGVANPPAGKFALSSPDFPSGGAIPREFTCEGKDRSPALKWTDPPAGTQSLALIVDDPDAPAGTWVHWVIYNFPATARQLAAGVAADSELSNGARQGQNDFQRLGYGGPCPPPGPAHRYFFKLYALDAKLDLKSGASKAEVENAMKGHALAKAELIGRYKRGSN